LLFRFAARPAKQYEAAHAQAMQGSEVFFYAWVDIEKFAWRIGDIPATDSLGLFVKARAAATWGSYDEEQQRRSSLMMGKQLIADLSKGARS
jgi:hypothetical protein